jgi:hypothetical protein
MKTQRIVSLAAVFITAGLSQVSATLYDITFTGADIWTYSADNAAQARTDQTAPRRYRDWTVIGDPVQATTYGYPAAGGTTGFGVSAPNLGFAFDEINLWGKGGAAASAWGEKYVAVPDDPNNGVTSWKVIAAPTGWTDGIVLGNQSYNTGPGAYPVWRSGTGSALSLANMSDPSFVFEFQVLISDPTTAFEPDGKLRVFFGGFSDDQQNTGPDNYEVSGVMTLTATQVPDASASIYLLGLAMAGLLGFRRWVK